MLVGTPGLEDTDLAAYGLTKADVLSMLSVHPTSGNAYVHDGTEGTVTWAFNSGGDAFDFLREGEVLTLYYNQVRPNDGHGVTTTGDGGITIQITGTNDAAHIALAQGTDVDVSEDESPTTLTAQGHLTVSDADQGEAAFQTTVTKAQGTLGNLVLAADGSYTYSVANSAVQGLGTNETKVETFTVKSADGTSQDVSFTIHGANDVAQIGAGSGTQTEILDFEGVASGNTYTEDGLTLTLLNSSTPAFAIGDFDGDGDKELRLNTNVGGQGYVLQMADGSQFTIQGVDVERSDGSYIGIIGSNGNRTFSGGVETKTFGTYFANLDNAQLSGLVDIDHLVITHQVPAGAAGEVTEDQAATLRASGALTITDADAGEASFRTQSGTAGSNGFGTFALDASGHWTYSADNGSAAIQKLGAGQTLTDSFTAVSFDGSASQVVTVTIHGTNDAAAIGLAQGADTSVTEDESATTLTATGHLTVSDADQGQASFQTQALKGQGVLGNLAVSPMAATATRSPTAPRSPWPRARARSRPSPSNPRMAPATMSASPSMGRTTRRSSASHKGPTPR
ncbi:Flagellin hook IN motif protein family [Rubellimicrobium mesophilum DSM 19309]|uniref:Flagellin hook IN motif protein family n=1 Tax=Rubellimicrobium mesophilum DSM 19309 TaxID=442562 RepID=A0A017HQ90_9RHOB|nr:Flagellin hook IN motif protein family [Rubellimicrobium mesophilum DSM 19309]